MPGRLLYDVVTLTDILGAAKKTEVNAFALGYKEEHVERPWTRLGFIASDMQL